MKKVFVSVVVALSALLGSCAGMHPHDAGGYLGAAVGASVSRDPALGGVVGYVGGRVAGQVYCTLNSGDIACREAGEPYRAGAMGSATAPSANPCDGFPSEGERAACNDGRAREQRANQWERERRAGEYGRQSVPNEGGYGYGGYHYRRYRPY